MTEHAPAFQYETAVKPEVCSVADTPPGEGVSRSGLPSRSEGLPKVETSKSEISLGSDKSFRLRETSVSKAFPGPREPAHPEPSAEPELGARSTHFLGEESSRGALRAEEPFLQEEEPQPMPLELLPALHDPFAAVEAKLARLSSTAAQADAPPADVPKVLLQVGDVMQDARQKVSGQRSWGHGVIGAHMDSSVSVAPAPSLWLQLRLQNLGAGSGHYCSGVWERPAL